MGVLSRGKLENGILKTMRGRRTVRLWAIPKGRQDKRAKRGTIAQLCLRKLKVVR